MPSKPRTLERAYGTSSLVARLAELLILGAIFFVSGFSALVYQIAWQRILALHSGVGIYSVAMITAAFLAGLGLGSYLGGRLSYRVRPSTCLYLFAGLEFSVGLFALASCFLYYDLLYLRLPWLFSNPWRAGIFHFLALVLPTLMMGMSLPLLVHAQVVRVASAAPTIGYLYGVNVLGAACGSLLTPWVLIPHFGIDGAVRIGALGNLAVGAVALASRLLSPQLDASLGETQSSKTVPSESTAGGPSFSFWVGLYTFSGFIALSLEIVWFRLLNVAVKSTAFTFGTLLAIFLLGLGLGSLLGGALAWRVRRPLQLFLLLQCWSLIYTGLTVLGLTSLPIPWAAINLPEYLDLVSYWGQNTAFPFGEDWNWRIVLSLYVLLPILLFGPPTVLMGFSFAVIQKAVHDQRRDVGWRVGVLQAGNIVGNVAGSLVCGLIFLASLGTAGTLRLLLGLGLVFVVVGVYHRQRRILFAITGMVLVGLCAVIPEGHRFWLRLHGQGEQLALIAEDASGVVAITQEPATHWDPQNHQPSLLRMTVNGAGTSYIPFGGVHTELGAIPAHLHPAPQEIAIIGLGSGNTAWAAACRRQTQQIMVFELAGLEHPLLGQLAQEMALPELEELLTDPRVEISVTDGRKALATDLRKYDIIEADPLTPRSMLSGNVNSVEFFQLCRERLKPGGIMCAWLSTPRVYRSFCDVFPHVLQTEDILLGSNQAIEYDAEEVFQRLAGPQAQQYLGETEARRIRQAIQMLRPTEPDRHDQWQPNRDLFPRDEYLVPKGGHRSRLAPRDGNLR